MQIVYLGDESQQRNGKVRQEREKIKLVFIKQIVVSGN